MKDILSQLLGEDYYFNDRKTLKPYEIDLYFPKFKLGFEYISPFVYLPKIGFQIKEIYELKKLNANYISVLIGTKDWVQGIMDGLHPSAQGYGQVG